MLVLQAWIPGRPVPQGSKSAMMPKHMKRPVLVDSNADRLKPWRAQVTSVMLDARRLEAVDVPVRVTAEFRFRRPKAHYGSGRNAAQLKASATAAPAGRGQGDVDKLVRALLDGMTDAGVYVDDCQVVELHARKAWGADEGVHVWVETMGDESADG